MKVTLGAWSQAKGFNDVAKKALEALGYRVTVKPVGDNYWDAAGDPRSRARIGFDGWGARYPAPSSFLVALFNCPGSLVGSPSVLDSSQFCDPRIDRLMRRAQAEQRSDPTRSRALWQRVDRDITDAAPWVPLIASTNVSVLSKRVGNYQYSPAAIAMLHRPTLGAVGQR
jgi:peptide/nickel transport system substrate-binding protein